MVNQNFQVLIVDDNEINRDMLSRRLHRRDLDIFMAVDGQEALDMVQTQTYDLILLDIMMPKLDGYAVLKHLKGHPQLKNIPVIMISAVEEMNSVMKCLEIGAEDYLTKPFDPDMLKAAINRSLEGRKKSALPVPPAIPYRQFAPLPNVNSEEANQISGFNLPDDTTRGKPTSSLTLDEVVLKIMQSGTINRKAYLYFSKAIFNTLFDNLGLSDQELYQIRSMFDAIQAGRVKVIDSGSSK
ncbi:MAG: hypothetical protein AUK48_06665 [Oscillatoriales cyanobacterium CG2_30_44_21]|nr:MAG: hypothetical protein AUK48_06665 [Oscillatoriales cyanobacterium CG2_30_44_21]